MTLWFCSGWQQSGQSYCEQAQQAQWPRSTSTSSHSIVNFPVLPFPPPCNSKSQKHLWNCSPATSLWASVTPEGDPRLLLFLKGLECWNSRNHIVGTKWSFTENGIPVLDTFCYDRFHLGLFSQQHVVKRVLQNSILSVHLFTMVDFCSTRDNFPLYFRHADNRTWNRLTNR